MIKLVRSAVLATALVVPFTLIASTSPASAADAAGAAILGSGTISPGLGAVPVPQSFSFTGTATGAGLVAGSVVTPLTPLHCSFAGTDLAGSAAEGAGFVNGACGAINLNAPVIGAFVRVGGAVVVAFAGTSPAKAAAGVFAFVPGDVNPTTKYTLAGVAGYASAP
jgi:hypothetical protein